MDVVSLKLQAAFEGADAYVRASDGLKGLAREVTATEASLAELDRTAKQVTGLQKLEAELRQTEEAIDRAERQAGQLRQALATADEQGAKQLAKALASTERELAKLQGQQERLTGKIERGNAALQKAGIETDDLAGAQAKLERQMAGAQAALDRQTKSLQEAATKQRALQQVQDDLSRSLALAGNITFVSDAALELGQAMDRTGFGFESVISKAVGFESAMADVRKVVSATPAQFEALTGDIRDLTRELPLAASELAQIAAAGGQLGVATDSLDEFTRLAAKMGVAFDLSAQQAGEALAKLSNVFEIPILEVEALGDAINTLGNNTAAREAQIVDVLTRIGGTGRQFGLAAEEVAALAASFVALGKPPEVAATAINALLSKLQTANVQSETFRGALGRLGIEAGQLAADISAAPQQALTAFLEKLRDLDALARAEILTQLFGAEYQDDLSILVGSLGQYSDALGLVSDKTRTAGALNAEFAARNETTANQLQLLRNALDDIAIGLGTTFLPPLRSAAAALQDFSTTFPGLSSALAGTLTAVGALGIAVGTLGKGYAAVAGFTAQAVAGLKTYAISAGAASAATNTLNAGLLTTAARLPLVAAGAKGALAAAVALGSYKLGEALGEWAFGADATTAALEALTATQDRLTERLAEVSRQTGITITSMAQFNTLVEEGSIYLSTWTGQWAAVSPEVIKLREELARLKAGVTEFAETALPVPDYLREGFARLKEEIPGLRAPTEMIRESMALLKVDVGEATNGIRTDFQAMADAFDVVTFRSGETTRAVELASAELVKNARSAEEVKLAQELLAQAFEAGRISATAAAAGLDVLDKALRQAGESFQAAEQTVWSFGGTLDEIQGKAREAQSFWELWAASGGIEQLYRAGQLTAQEYLIEQDKILARMKEMREENDRTTDSMTAGFDKARDSVKGLNSELEKTEELQRRTRSVDVGSQYETAFQRFGSDLGRVRSSFGAGIPSSAVAQFMEGYTEFLRTRSGGGAGAGPSVSDLQASTGGRYL